jgi:cell division protein FtsQ
MENGNVIYDERIPQIKEKSKKQKTSLLIMLLILLFFLLILFVIYLQSPLSKLQQVDVMGASIFTNEQLIELAGLEIGGSYYNIRTSAVKNRIERLVEIEQAEVTRIWPNHLKIDVKEHPITSFWIENNQLYPVLISGHIILHRPWNNGRVTQPVLTYWPSKDGLVELNRELDKLPQPVIDRISEITLTPIESDPYRLSLFMTDGFEVITSIRKFAENMVWYPQFVQQVQAEGKRDGTFFLLDGKWFEEAKDEINMLEAEGEAGEQNEGN